MKCRGKALQLAALLLALACNGASSAAVHRAQGVDAITAKLVGHSVTSHVRPEGAETPNSHFSPDSWQPVFRELSARRTYEDSSKSKLEGVRQQYFPQPRAASIDDVTPTAAAAPVSTTVAAAAVTEADSKKRSPEVRDSIAAVASQLLNERPTVMEMRKPVAAPQTGAEPDKKWEKVVVTNAVPLKVTAQTDKPVTKVPPISEMATKNQVASTTAKSAPAMPTRFPPRKPAVAVSSVTEKMVEITTRKPALATVAIKKPVIEILSTLKPAVATTTAAPVKKTTVVTDKKPVAVKTEATTSRTTVTVRRPSSTVPVTILRNSNSSSVASFTTSRPAPFTESIPITTRTTARPATQKQPAKPVSSAIFRLPSASVITKAPETTKRTPPRFEILSTQKATTLAASSRAPPTTTSTTTTTTTTAAPETTTVKKSKKKPSKKTKKNKKRRRRPSKPENKVGTELEEKEEKPLTSRIYDYLSGDIIPSFGTTMVGLLMTAGLAGLFLLPIEGFARRSDQFKREEEEEGILPSILKAVYTSVHPPEAHNDAFYADEQGPRRFKRQYRFEGVPYQTHPASSMPVRYRPRHPYPMYKQAESNIMSLEASQQPFSIVRLIKQMLAVKLDVLSGVLRTASEHLRNYAQHAEIKKPTPVENSNGTSTDSEERTETEATPTELPQDVTESVMLKSVGTSSETPLIKDAVPVADESDEANLIRRRTAD